MSGFSVVSPSWDTIDAVEVIDQIRIEKDHALIPTDQGLIRLSVNQFGVRIQIGERIDFDYQMLVNQPKAQSLTIAQPSSSPLSSSLSTPCKICTANQAR